MAGWPNVYIIETIPEQDDSMCILGVFTTKNRARTALRQAGYKPCNDRSDANWVRQYKLSTYTFEMWASIELHHTNSSEELDEYA